MGPYGILKDDMKIAMMVRSFLETPVPNDINYSPTSVALPLAEGLAKKGHQVTFFGPSGTNVNGATVETCGIRPLVKTSSELDEMVSTPDLFTDYQFGLHDTKMAREMLSRAQKGEFDCVVFHHFESALPLASMYPDVPVIYILHDYMDEQRVQAINMHLSPNQHFISISNSQRQDAPDLPYRETVYNGVDIDIFSYEDQAEDYLFCAGRISPDKGMKEAVQAAIAANRRLLIAGSLSNANRWYFDEHIKPFLNDKILFLGRLDQDQLVKYYKKAYAFLMPIQWSEPFGLTMAEAGACGTPVIAFRRGAVPEIIEDGKTGFIVDNSAEMIMAIDKVATISRKHCRDHIEKNFTTTAMIERYEKVLTDIVSLPKQIPHSTKKRHRHASAEFGKIIKRFLQ